MHRNLKRSIKIPMGGYWKTNVRAPNKPNNPKNAANDKDSRRDKSIEANLISHGEYC